MQPVDAAGLVEFKWIPDALRPQRLSRMDEMGGGGMVDLTPLGGEVGESRASSMSQGAPHPKMTQGEAQTVGRAYGWGSGKVQVCGFRW